MMFSFSTCGNKVSPASLLNSNECSSIDTGIMSGGETQLSQVSLFSSSECTNSLELFSQPPTHSQDNAFSSKVCCEPASNLSQYPRSSEAKTSDGKKYYMKYLSSISRVPPQITNDGKSVKDSNREGLEDKLPFDIWKEKQQKRRHGSDAIEEASIAMKKFAEETLELLKEDVGSIVAEIKSLEEKRTVEDRTRYTTQLTQILEEQERNRQIIQELKEEVLEQKSMLESVTKQVCALSTLPADTSASLTKTLLPRLLKEMSLRKPPSSSTTHVGTQTLESRKRCEKLLTPTENVQDMNLDQYSRDSDTDQSVPSIFRQLPANGESKKRINGDKMAELPLDQLYWNQENQQQHQHQLQEQKQHNQQQTIVPFELDYSTSNKSCMKFGMDPSPVYDLDLTQLPVVIEKETCDSVRIERKVVYGKRHLVERSPFGLSKLKYPKKSITTVTSSSQIGEDFKTRRRSKRNIRKIPSYCCSTSGSEGEENEESYKQSPSILQIKPAPFKTKLRRKVSSNYQDNCLSSCKRSDLKLRNADDISFFSGSNTVFKSSTKDSYQEATHRVKQQKFNRTSESVRRRQKVISNMTGAGMDLRKLENSILNNHLKITDPSP